MKNCTLDYNDCTNKKTHCRKCTRSTDPGKGELTDHYVSPLDQVNKIYEFLHGFKPKLSYKKAFSVIYFLQEHIRCLPDHIEQCQDCLELFDADKEGFCLSNDYELDGKDLPEKYHGHWCDNCVPAVDFQMK